MSRAWQTAIFLVIIAMATAISVVGPQVILFGICTAAALMAWRTSVVLRKQLWTSVHRQPFFSEILLMPLAVGLAYHQRLLGIALLAALVASTAVRSRIRLPTMPLALGVAAGAIVALFGAQSPMIIVIGAIVIVVSSWKDRHDFIDTLIDGLGLYTATNILAYFILGLRPLNESRFGNALEASGGIFTQRILFPLSPSEATPPVIAAAFLVGVAPLIVSTRRHRSFRYLASLCAIAVLLSANYRVPMVATTLLVSAILIRPRWLSQCAPIVVAMIFLLPFGYSAVEHWTVQVIDGASTVLPSLSRERTGDASSLNGRTTIWNRTLAARQDFTNYRKLFGYGPNGHINSGISQQYAFLLKGGFTNPLVHGSHSTAIQQLIDGGIVGLVLLFGAIAVTSWRLRSWARHDVHGLSALGVLLIIASSSATESLLAPGPNLLGFAVLLALSSVATTRTRTSRLRQRTGHSEEPRFLRARAPLR